MKLLNHASARSLKRFGWPGAVGLFCLGGVAVLALLLSPKWAVEAAEMDAHADRLQARLRLQWLAAPAKQLESAQATPQAWMGSLPELRLQQQRLVDLLELGSRQGVQIARTEHRLTTDPASGLARLRITMPLRGSYAQVRGYVSAALKADPSLSLDGLKLRRATTQATELEGELQWSLLSRQSEVAR